VAGEIKLMSAYLKMVKEFKSPSPSVIRATKINKVLKRIRRLGEIPGDSKFHFKERAASLLGKWAGILKKEEQFTRSTTTNDNVRLATVPNSQQQCPA
jgi:hypothetical protein